MCNKLISFSTWVESNAGQIQILIGLIALAFAVLAYRKVLEQVEISNGQTNLTLKQMTSLNKERQADLKISLLSELNIQIRQLIEIKHNYDKLTIDINNFETLLNTDVNRYSNLISNMPMFKQIFNKSKTEKIMIVDTRLKDMKDLYEEIYTKETDVNTLENTIQQTYKNNREIDEITVELNQILLSMDKLESSAR
ncbi:hypothetical protein [Acinetobacter seifertii]|uniref:hypothetical protein n=1 Tax=Acinetobacter seifertii TaxID=1530123 RepID=UPI003F522F5A